MRRLLKAIPLLLMGGLAHAVTNGAVAISSGSAFYTVDTSSMPNTNVRQNIVIGDPSTASGLAPVNSVQGLSVYLASSTAQIGAVTITQPSVLGATVTFNGTQNVQLQTGSNAIGSITNTGFTVSTGGVTSAQGPPGTADWHVTQSTNAVTGTVTISTGGVSAYVIGGSIGNTSFGVTQPNALNVVSTQTVVSISTNIVGGVAGSTVAIVNAQGTTIAISGSITSSSVNITTAAPNGAMPTAIAIVGGVNASGLAQSFAVDTSSRVQITGSITSTSVNITTTAYNTAFPAQGNAITFVGPTGLTQAGRVNVSSDQYVQQGGAGTADWHVTLSTNNAYVMNLTTVAATSFFPNSYAMEASTFNVASAASATDIALLCGNATTNLYVRSVRISCTQTTAGMVGISLIKRTSADLGVWSTMTVTYADTNFDTQYSSATFFTANPGTLGTFSGFYDNTTIGCMAAATATPNDILISPSDWRDKPQVLRGATQCMAVNLQAKTVTGGAFNITYDWLETSNTTP